MTAAPGTVAVVDSGSGNLHSVEKALAHSGARVVVTSDPDQVRRADRIVVPGQGAFGDCVAALRQAGLDQAIADRIAAGTPYFGICLGLQVLFDESEEHGPVAGLGIVPGRVVRLCPERLKVPHIGWNRVAIAHPDPLLEGIPDGGHFYFIHSYHAVPADPAAVVLSCEYGGQLTAAIRVDNLFACQFHPEKSQQLGLRLLANFVAGAC